MANIIGELSVLLDAVTKPFNEKMGEAVAVVRQTTNDINKATTGAGKGFDIATVAAGGFIGALGAQAVASAAGAITDLGVALVRAGAAAETSQTAFKTMLGSASAATDMLRRLQQFAASTPFEFEELQDAARKMLAFGVAAEDVIPTLRIVGDAVSALGGGQAEIDRVTRALGQMQAKGKVSAEEMQQLAELGIPAWKLLADQIGVSIPEAMKMAEAGTIDAARGIDAILRGMQQQFAGGMEAQSKTLEGMWSNLKDQLAEIARILGTMMVPALKEMLVALGPAVQEMGELVKQFRLWNEERKGTASRRSMMAEEVELANKGFQGSITDIRNALTGLQQTQEGVWTGYIAGVDSGTLKTEQFGSSAAGAIAAVGKSASENKVHIDELQKAVWAIFAAAHAKEVEKAAQLMAVAIGGIGAASAIAEAQMKSLDEMIKDSVFLSTGGALPQAKDEIATIATGLSEAENNMLIFVEGTRRGTQAAKDLRIQWGEWTKEQQEGFKKSQQVMQEVSTIINDLGRDLAKAIIHWKGFKEAGLSALEAIGEAILRQLIANLIKASGIIDKVAGGIGGLLGIGSSAAKTTSSAVDAVGGGIDLMAGVKGIKVPGASKLGGAAMSGAMGWISAGASVVSAVSDIIGNFQMARQENTLNAIEWNTRKSSIHLEYLLEKANETWPYLQHINSTLWTGGGGGGIGTQITVNYTGDVRSLAMMLLSELQRMGMRVAPA